MNLSTAYNVLQCKSDLEAVLHGTTLNQVTGVNNLFNRTARQLLMDCDPQETIQIAQTPVLYDSIWDYPITNLSDLKGDKIIDVRPQVNRSIRDVFNNTYAQQFDVTKQYTTVPGFTINFNGAQKTLRVNATDLITGITLNQADGTATNGTWTAGSNVSNLTTNSTNSVDPAGSSLQFDISAGANPTTANIYNSTMTAVDLSAHLNQSTLFWYVYLPTGSDITSVSLSWGSSASAYWTVTATQNWLGEAFVNGWNLIGATWLGAVKTGSPDSTAINYVNASFVTNGNAQTAVLLNNITSRLGKIFDILYYSKYLFRDSSTGAFKETVTSDADLINLDTDTFQVFFNLLAYYTVQQISGGDMQADMQFFMNEYQKGIQRYNAMYKSQRSKPQLTYYNTPKPSYQKYFGRGWWQ